MATKKIITFFFIDDEGTLNTSTIIAENIEQALELCGKDFIPEAYHEIDLNTVCKVSELQEFNPVILANNDDLKEV